MKVVDPIREKEQINTMKSILSAGKMGDRNELLFSIGINTAYRISDLRRLKLLDVLVVSRGKIVAKDRLEMKEKKTGKNNSIIISKKLKQSIKDYTYKHFPDALEEKNFDLFLFPSAKGENQPINRQQLWAIFNAAAKKIGLENIGCHSMRKTFGYFLYKNNIDMEIIQELLNHSSQRETLRYIGITQEDKDTAVMSLDL